MHITTRLIALAALAGATAHTHAIDFWHSFSGSTVDLTQITPIAAYQSRHTISDSVSPDISTQLRDVIGAGSIDIRVDFEGDSFRITLIDQSVLGQTIPSGNRALVVSDPFDTLNAFTNVSIAATSGLSFSGLIEDRIEFTANEIAFAIGGLTFTNQTATIDFVVEFSDTVGCCIGSTCLVAESESACVLIGGTPMLYRVEGDTILILGPGCDNVSCTDRSELFEHTVGVEGAVGNVTIPTTVNVGGGGLAITDLFANMPLPVSLNVGFGGDTIELSLLGPGTIQDASVTFTLSPLDVDRIIDVALDNGSNLTPNALHFTDHTVTVDLDGAYGPNDFAKLILTFSTPAACCLGQQCLLVDELACDQLGGQFLAGQACDQTACISVPPPCREDFNSNNLIEVADIFAFLAEWFAGCP